MPLPSTLDAHVHSTEPLLAPHMRSKPQRESHGREVQTPLRQSRPEAHALPQRPQCAMSFLRSWQPPSQRETPGPPQVGGGRVGSAEEVEEVKVELEAEVRVNVMNCVVEEPEEELDEEVVLEKILEGLEDGVSVNVVSVVIEIVVLPLRENDDDGDDVVLLNEVKDVALLEESVEELLLDALDEAELPVDEEDDAALLEEVEDVIDSVAELEKEEGIALKDETELLLEPVVLGTSLEALDEILNEEVA